ncbi:GHKL domain-containing protein [bacterium D16-51]|nr:GHKL domain-containing protein [bacterium D16-59]RKI61022.1 GHKL domain-containing protein [bacterium D16-51]
MWIWIVLARCLLEIGCLMKTMKILTGQKDNRGYILQYFIVVAMLAVNIYINFFSGSSLLQMLYYLGIFCIFIIRYGMGVIDALVYMILSFLIVGVLELLVYVPCNLIYSYFYGNGDCSFIVVLLSFLICFFVERKGIFVSNRRIFDNYKEKINLQFICIVFVVLFIFIVSLLRFDKGMSWDEGIYLSAAVFMFIMLVYKYSGYRMEIDYHRRYADKYGEVITELRERQHKFMNQLDSIYALCKIYDNYDELVQHQAAKLDNLRRYLMPGKILILERPLVVAHMYTKLCEAEEKQIDIHTDFSCSLEHVNIPDIFLIEILGNLLDNAMDEVLTRKRNEKIRVTITDDGNKICISVGNEHEKIPYKEYSRFFKDGYSVKGEGHGVGLPYVKKIVDKYHGNIQVGNVMYGTDNYFVVSIYLKR